MSSNISAVLAVNTKVELLKKFYTTFRSVHPNIPLVVSALQADKDVEEYLKNLDDVNLKVVFGNPVDGHHVSFSENYNSAINAVETERLVLIHTDMYLSENFFNALNEHWHEGNFTVYTTMEPPIYIGHRRPGKVIGDFGTNFDNFKTFEFEDYCRNITKDLGKPGYGFFLAGAKKDFEAIGGFDQVTFNPVFCEDDDFMVRLRIKGYYAYVNDQAISYHFVSQTTRKTAGDPMADREFRANRAFGRKWGFEARYLWTTGYEAIDSPLKVTNREILLDPGKHVDMIYGLEPLFDKVIYGESKVVEEAAHKVADNTSEYDIKVELTPAFSNKDVTDLFYTLGGLRLCTSPLKVGKYLICNGTVLLDIKESVSKSYREDTHDYLSLQKTIKYE